MYKFIALVITLLSTLQFAKAQQVGKSPLIIGETIAIESNILNEKRAINIHLPSSYNPNSMDKYPVFYLLDGSIDEDFIHVVGNVQFCSFSWINIIPESIVVGISNVDRKRDFTYPSKLDLDQKEFPTSGKSSDFIDFISEELQPYIVKHYKTNNETTLICLLYTSPSPRDATLSRMPSSA